MKPTLTQLIWSELFGTFWIVFAGTGAIIVNDLSAGAISHIGIAITFGLTVFAMISALGNVSGAHFNPAVTFGFYLAKRLSGKMLLPYIGSQIAGAILASFLLHYLFPLHTGLGATLPSGSALQSFLLEIILMLGLMFVILSTSHGAKEKGITAGLAIGSVVALEALFAGPISGASMNPARSLAPALVSGHFAHLWIYFTAPFLGSMLAVLVCACTQSGDCCAKQSGSCHS